MAENLGEVKVKITVDSDEFKKGAAEVEQQIDDLDKKLSEVGDDKTTAGIEDAVEKLDDLKGAAAQVAPKVTTAASALSTVGTIAAVIGGALVILAPALIKAGQAIVNWFNKVREAREYLLELGRATREANEAIYQGAGAAAENVVQFRLLSEEWQGLSPDQKATEFDRVAGAVNKMGIEVNNVNDLDEIFIEQSDDVINALVARAKATAALQQITEAQSKVLSGEERARAIQTEIDALKAQDAALKAVQSRLAGTSTEAAINSGESPLEQQINSLQAKLDAQLKANKLNGELIERLIPKYKELNGEAAKLSSNSQVKKGEETVVETLTEVISPAIGSLDELNEKLKIARENYGKAATDEMRQYYAAEIAGIEEAIDALEREAEAYLKVQQRAALGTIAPATGSINMQDLIGSNYGIGELPAMETPAAVLKLQNAIREANEAMQLEAERWNETLNSMFGHTVADSISGGIEAITDAIMGVGDIDATSAVDAFLSPFADMSVRLGEMMVAMGVAESAFLSGFNPAQKIAAGVALIALGKLYKSAVESAGKNTGSTASANSNSWTGGGQLAAATNTPLQIEVYGTLSGQDIVLAGNNYMNNQRR